MQRLLEICIAELLGTAILCGFGLSSIAVNTIDPSRGSSLQVHISWGIGAMFGVYFTRQKGPGHINPAVTFSKMMTKELKASNGVLMILSQCCGAFLGAAIVYWIYVDIDVNYANATIFATYPRDGVSMSQAIVSSVAGTCFMILAINGVTQAKLSHKPELSMLPVFTVMTYGICFSLNTGYAINPARDIGPRVLIFLLGFPDSFSRGNDLITWYWWIPLVSPLVGAILANFLFGRFVKSEYCADAVSCCAGNNGRSKDELVKIVQETA